MRSSWGTVAFVVLSMLGAGCRAGAAPPAVGPLTTEGTVAVGGLSLYVHCTGQGAPLVVLEAGLGSDGRVWDKVEPEIGRFTHVCDYDRAGLGRSGPAPRPHTNRQMARELRTLLEQAGLAGPYVLVGHSMGGTNVRLFAREYPDDVAGMVLVDSATGDDWLRSFTLHPDASKAEFKAALLQGSEGLDYDTLAAGLSDLEAPSRTLGDAPLVVLTRGKELDPPPPGVSPELAAQLAALHRETQPELLGLSSNSVQLMAPKSGHFIQREAPDLVVGAVHEVVDAARAHRHVDAGALSRGGLDGVLPDN